MALIDKLNEILDKLNAIGDAIRFKTGKTAKLTLDEMPAEIKSIVSVQTPAVQPLPIIQPLEVSKNGVYTAPSGVDGYSPVSVNVPIPNGYIKPSGDIAITENGEYDVTAKARAIVNVAAVSDTSVEDSIITRGITKYANDRVSTVGAQAFYGCSKLKSVYFAKATSVGSNSFRGCTQLKSAIFPKATVINANAFNGCSAFATLILGSATACKLGAATSLSGTLIASNIGYVYVRYDLVEEVRGMSNWSSIATQIMPYVSTVDILNSVDGTVYERACVWEGGEEFTEYYYDSLNTQWVAM